MAKQTINIGASPNDGTGTPLRTSFDYTNQNFTEIYTALGGGVALPGATTQVIFNDGGTNLAGDAGLVYNKTTDALTVAGLVTAASATITGALTVGAAANFNGGVTAGYLNGSLFFGSSGNFTNLYCKSSGYVFYNTAGTFSVLNIDNTGFATFQDGAGGTRMTLNSTGLGFGTSPSYNIDVLGATLPTIAVRATSAGASNARFYLECAGTNSGNVTYNRSLEALQLGANGATSAQVTLNSLGNFGVGAAPSTPWATNRRALQIGGQPSGALALTGTSGSGELFFNSFFNSTSQNICVVTGGTGKYDFNVGTVGCHTWSVGTGTAGTAFTFTQAMILDASGNLILQSSATPATLATNGQLTVNATSNTNLRFSYRGSDGTTRVANITLA
jgi:hypothetical protein